MYIDRGYTGYAFVTNSQKMCRKVIKSFLSYYSMIYLQFLFRIIIWI